MMELRDTVLKEIQSCDNQDLLAAILEMVRWSQDKSKFLLSEDQRASIEVARQQIKDGKVKSHREVMEETSRWLNSK